MCNLMPLCPAELIPLVLSKSMVRSLLAARVNKKSLLHTLALDAIERIASGAASDPTARIALASVLVQHGKMMNTRAVGY